MLAFEVAGGRAAGRAIIDALTLPELTASLGSVHTMVVHPPSTSHRQSTEAELLAAGITPGLLRVSVGLEDLEDLQADFATRSARPRRRATGGPSRPSAPSRGPSHREPGRRLDGHEPDRPAANIPARLGYGLWRLFTSVDFAVVPDHLPGCCSRSSG